ncbi:MAG: endonuclease III [Christensenellaceae bacterium]|nr:endonuclease III [Christensenellaceae bacterium]
MEKKQEILNRLSKVYAGAKPALNFTNAYELLVATILSAQCTDARVNKVTEQLFVSYPSPADLAAADYDTLCNQIHSCGCYAVKAKNLKATANRLMDDFGGAVPRTMEELTTLPGVGRKTANVVLSNAYGIPGMAVDTHVFRVSNRLGLADAKDVEKTEQQLCALIPKEKWGEAHHWLIYHGRQVCSARKPACETCFLADICPWEGKGENKK